MMMDCCGGLGWLMMLGMVVGATLWVLLLAGLIWGLIRWLESRSSPRPRRNQMAASAGPSASEILEQRYARGEIDRDTYEQMRDQFQASSSP